MNKTLQEHSRDDHCPSYGGPPTYQEIQVGALLRIAEAVEIIVRALEKSNGKEVAK